MVCVRTQYNSDKSPPATKQPYPTASTTQHVQFYSVRVRRFTLPSRFFPSFGSIKYFRVTGIVITSKRDPSPHFILVSEKVCCSTRVSTENCFHESVDFLRGRGVLVCLNWYTRHSASATRVRVWEWVADIGDLHSHLLEIRQVLTPLRWKNIFVVH